MGSEINIYLQLFGCSLVSVGLSVLFYMLEQLTPFSKIPYWARQLIIGIVFGAAAVFGTEFGVDIGGAVANARDAAPICAGLFFGSPAGIIAGIIGGVERWFAVNWGQGTYSQIACSLSTVLAGIYAAFLRKYIFDNKRPTPIFSLATGAIMEIIHMTILFLTHLNDTEQAFEIVKKCTLPMTFCNGISVWLAAMLIGIASTGTRNSEKTYRRISQQVQTPLLIAVVLAFFATSGFVYVLQTNSAIYDTQKLMQINLSDVYEDIKEESEHSITNAAENIAAEINSGERYDLYRLANKYGVTAVRIVDNKGNILHSTRGDKGNSAEGFDNIVKLMRDNGNICTTVYACYAKQKGNIQLQAFVRLDDEKILQTEYNAEALYAAVAEQTDILTANRHIGEQGYVLITDNNLNIISGKKDFVGKTLTEIGISDYSENTENLVSVSINGEDSYILTSEIIDSFTAVVVMSKEEVFTERDNIIYVNAYMEILVFASLFIVVYIIVKKIVVIKIQKVNSSLGKIIGGDLNTVVDVRSSDEFASLSDDINSTVCTLKHYIDEAASRIDRELEFAKSIQHSALPSVFPAFPDNAEFDIYASMNTAKEVGGDFYDFYLLPDGRLGFIIADVSGKGIPAAMFMMTAKTMIKNFAESGLPLDEIFEKANNKLCEGNEAEMFVTAWMGIIDTKTGTLSFVNAGHNPPLIKNGDGGYEYLKTKPGLVLACMEDMKYKVQERTLKPGDRIFLYTDGVTEAMDTNGCLYGEERLKNILEGTDRLSVNEIPDYIQNDINAFIKGAEQFDDITMLALEFIGENQRTLRCFDADIKELDSVMQFLEEELSNAECPQKTVMQISLCVEEAFVNVANYAYPDKNGKAEIEISAEERSCEIVLSDTGVPFNPLEQDSPDVTLAAEDRKIGGLGIFLIKKQMDNVCYDYIEGRNVLRMSKKW